MKAGFRRTVNWNNHQSKVSIERPNEYLDYLIDPSFQGVNRLFYHLKIMNTEQGMQGIIKDYNVKIDGQNIFDQPVKNNLRTYDNIQKIETCQGDHYTTGSLLYYPYFKENYKLIAIDLSKQEAFDADPKAIQQINFTGNPDEIKILKVK